MGEITLYHTQNSRSIRPRWLMLEMGLDFNLVKVPYKLGHCGDEDYDKIHPMRRIPALTHGGIKIFESLAILDYLTMRYDKNFTYRPDPEAQAYAEFLQYFHFGESSFGTSVTQRLAHVRLLPESERLSEEVTRCEHNISGYLKLIDQQLDGRDYLMARGFSTADISVAYMLFLLKISQGAEGFTPRISAYWNRIKSRPAWIAASQD